MGKTLYFTIQNEKGDFKSAPSPMSDQEVKTVRNAIAQGRLSRLSIELENGATMIIPQEWLEKSIITIREEETLLKPTEPEIR